MNQEKFEEAKRCIAHMANSPEDVPFILVLLARVPDEEWESTISRAKPHVKTHTKGLCPLCFSSYGTYRVVFAEICDDCYATHELDVQRLKNHRQRAKNAGLPSTLTMAEWMVTLEYFHHMCAYCQERSYACVDHFIPICKRGGTVAENCVPACKECNLKKMHEHPGLVTSISREALDRVHAYLKQRGSDQFFAEARNLPENPLTFMHSRV